jgi:hypothetical protein
MRIQRIKVRVSFESLQASLSRITPIPKSRIMVLHEGEITDDDPPKTLVLNEARDHVAEEEDMDASPLPEGEDNRDRDDILSKITEDNQKEMLEQSWMLLKLLFEQQAKWKVERIRMFTELDRRQTTNRPENPRSQSKVLKMVDPLRY